MSGSDLGDRSSVFTAESVPAGYARHLAPVIFQPWAEVLLDAVRSLLERAGCSRVQVDVVELQVTWRDDASAAAGALGTPFGPLIDALSADRRGRLQAALLARFAPEEPGGVVRRQTAAVVATASH